MEAWASVGCRGDGATGSSSPGKRRDRDVPLREIDREPAQFLLSLYKRAFLGQGNTRLTPVVKAESRPLSGFPGPLDEGEARSQHITEMYQVRFPPSLPPGHSTLGKGRK